MAAAIRKLFSKKKADVKFKLAGPGQKLGDTQEAAKAAADAKRAAAASSSSSSKRVHQEASDEQKAAANAALQRYQQSSSDKDFESRRSQALIRAQAKRELEREKQVEAECQKLRDTYGEKPAVESDGLVSKYGVFYHCPLIGPQVMNKDEMRSAIRDFLYAQLEEERGLTACLIIYTCNANKEKIQTCVETLCKYLNNILENPTEPKFRKIRKSNKIYQERVVEIEGHDQFLMGVGFGLSTIDDEEFWIYGGSSENTDVDIDKITYLKEALLETEPVKAELDRNLKVFLPSSTALRNADIPPDFFVVSPEEIKQEQAARTEMLESQGMLKTKAMRERERIKEKRNYRFTLIRIRFPDGFILQGTFSAYEPFISAFEFVKECLEIPADFAFADSAGGRTFTADSAQGTILDVGGLVPAVLLNFKFTDPDLNAGSLYLREELKSLAIEG